MGPKIVTVVLVGAGLAAPFGARADYLYSVFKDDSCHNATEYYAAAEPVIATVPQEKSEVDRVSRNFMVYAAFNTDATDRDFYMGHLYGLRLFQEVTESGEKVWKFNEIGQSQLGDCGPNKPCIFDAGKMLTERDKFADERRIFTGLPPSTLPASTDGRLTVSIESARRLVLGSDASAGAATLETVWARYAALPWVGTTSPDDSTNNTNTRKGAMHATNLPALPTGMTAATLAAPDYESRLDVVKWLHGVTRDWDLGDIYHATASVVEPPALRYKDHGYPQYKAAARAAKRPWMIYVGANDGMIHAFYASPDYEKLDRNETPRWLPGEEAWAYLPMNMLAKTLVEVKKGSPRFFSMDSSCRFTDVLVDDKTTYDSDGKPTGVSCGSDPFCGWRTVLICGEGWGGSWYVALDVTDPLARFDSPEGAGFKPLWEFTHFNKESASGNGGLGRTWSLPSISLMNYNHVPTWALTFGNGYNTSLHACIGWSDNKKECDSVNSRRSYRMLNLLFEGSFPNHGNGTGSDSADGYVWVQNMATGAVIKRLALTGAKNVVADVPSVDTDSNGVVDAAYAGGWNGTLYRIYFGDKLTSNDSAIGWCALKANQDQITSNPAVFAHPEVDDLAYLMLGVGIDSGRDPDQQRNEGKFWKMDAFTFTETGTATCGANMTTICGSQWWSLGAGLYSRLLGQPVFSRQPSGRDWLLFTTWEPPKATGGNVDICGSGAARLWCLDVTDIANCRACVGFEDGKGNESKSYSRVLYEGLAPPSAPATADGRVYVSTPSGLDTQGVFTGSQGPTPNSNMATPSSVRVVSWREVF